MIAVAYDCVEEMVYWTDITEPAISRARLSGGDVVPVVTTGASPRRKLCISYGAKNIRNIRLGQRKKKSLVKFKRSRRSRRLKALF